MKSKSLIFIKIIILSFSLISCEKEVDKFGKGTINPENKDEWELSWSDEFDYITREDFLKNWKSKEGHSGNTSVLSSSWKENVEVGNGSIKLVARKENRLNDLKWTGASIRSLKKFQFGYFECRYKYAAASGTNNSFWLMPDQPGSNKDYEIDINEGHYPNIVNTNTHIYNPQKGITIDPTSKKFSADFSNDYHLFGLEWTEDELIWYLNRREIRRTPNTSCYTETPLILSLAIITWAGTVTDIIDGKYMEVDYVRVYKPTTNR